jgi:hypothetical protein
MTRRKLTLGVALVIAAGSLAFAFSALAAGNDKKPPSPKKPPTHQAPVPRGATISAKAQGAVGMDVGDVNMEDGQPMDWGTVISLPGRAKVPLDDDHVIVVASQCSTDDPPNPTGCGSESSDEDTALCPSTWANGQLPSNPQATKGFLCVYVLNGTDFGTLVGTGAIHGVSIVAGTGGSALGGKVVFTPEKGDDAFFEGVWAYNGSLSSLNK